MNSHGIRPVYRTLFRLSSAHGGTEVVAIPNSDIDPSIVVGNYEPLTGTDAYESAASGLLAANRWASRRVYVTSPRPGDGKTRTAFNLATALAVSGKSVLLVEMNFMHPRFRALLGNLRFRYGLDSAVCGAAVPSESVFSVEATGLHVAAVRNSTPDEKLEGVLNRLNDFLDWGNSHYELLIMDCPSILSYEWNRWFHASVGQALLVVREQQTAVVDVQSSMRLLKGHLTGALLNSFVESRKPPIQRHLPERIETEPEKLQLNSGAARPEAAIVHRTSIGVRGDDYSGEKSAQTSQAIQM